MALLTPSLSTYESYSVRIFLPGISSTGVPSTTGTARVVDQPTTDQFLPTIPRFPLTRLGATRVTVRRASAGMLSSMSAVDMTQYGYEPPPSSAAGPVISNFTPDVGLDEAVLAKIAVRIAVEPALIESTDPDNILETMIAAGRQAIAWRLATAVVNSAPSGSPVPAITGLAGLAPIGAANTLSISTTTAPPAIDVLTALARVANRCMTSSGPADALVASGRAINALMRAEYQQGASPVFGPSRLAGGAHVYHFRGLPVLTAPVDDNQGGEDDVTSVYAVKLAGSAGLRLAHHPGEGDLGITVARLPRLIGWDEGVVNPTASLAPDGFMGGVTPAIVHGHYALVAPEPYSVTRLSGLSTVDTLW